MSNTLGDTATIMKYGTWLIIGGAIAFIAYEVYKALQNPATPYDVATSNPISEAGSNTVINSTLNSEQPSQNYNNVYDVYTSTPMSAQQLITLSLQKGEPVVDITPSGISTSNANVAITSGTGSVAEPFNYTEGWQGAGFYQDMPNKYPTLTQYFATQSGYNSYSTNNSY
jgi:hypothetical protein